MSQQRRALRLDPSKNKRNHGNHLGQESQHHTHSQRPCNRVKRRPLRAQRSNTVEDSDADEDEREGDSRKQLLTNY